MGAPIGNKNSAKARPWAEAIRKSIARYDMHKEEEDRYLNKLAVQLMKKALEGDKDAMEEITNRLDGKYIQPNTLSNDPEDGEFKIGLPWLLRQIQERNSV